MVAKKAKNSLNPFPVEVAEAHAMAAIAFPIVGIGTAADRLAALRENAAQSPENLEAMSPENTQRTLHKLRVHQI